MASFKDWALQYVLSDDEPVQRDLAEKAAREIENTRANSTVLGNWALSVNQWLTTPSAGDVEDEDDDGVDTSSGDIIARAKALGYLADTLEVLDRNILKTEQVYYLVGFFGAMFSYDHKAGITAAAKALRKLYSMKGFNPSMGAKMVEEVLKIKEDFRLQTAVTRLEIYELFLSLLQNESVSSEIQHKYGTSLGFIVDLLQLCQHERDPKNLILWFKILPVLLVDYSPSPELTEEIFKAFSAYFPISIRSSATPTGITAEDLKESVRSCFASHQRVAPLAFPFLMQKLDQGDAVTVAVKVDILRTIKACVERYDNPQSSVVPYIEKIWSSLKYEVRNGEVKETIDATLEVLRAIANKLDGTKTIKYEESMLKNYIDLVFKDCRDDLSNPTYTKQAGLLLVTVITANIRAFVLESAGFVDSIRQNLRQPKSPSHKRDLILLLNSMLKARQELVKNSANRHAEDEEQLKNESHTHLEALFHDVYLPIWGDKPDDPDSDTVDSLKKATQGLALLVSQEVVQPNGHVVLLCSQTTCSEICSLLTQSLVKGLTLSSNDNNTTDSALQDEAVLALRTVVMNYREGYADLVKRARADIRKRDWARPSRYSLEALKALLSRLAFIGCSEIPSSVTTDGSSQIPYSPLQHFITLTATLLDIFPLHNSDGSTCQKESLANSYVIAALHGSMLHFRDACVARYQKDDLSKYSGSDENWVQEFASLPGDWIQKLQDPSEGLDRTAFELAPNDPEAYRQFLRLSLFIVRKLYREASVQSGSPWSERILAQLSKIAALVVRALDEKLQICCKLATVAFDFFGSFDAVPSTSDAPSCRDLLTLGILEGLWPGAMTELYQPDGIADTYMSNAAYKEDNTSQWGEIRSALGAILANKYKGPPTTSPQFLRDQATSPPPSSNVDSKTFEDNIKVFMNILAGAAARQDKIVIEAVHSFHAAIGSPDHGEIAAQSLGIIIQDNEFLTAENHAVVKRFYKQWAYNYVAKPLYELASPRSQSNGTDPLTTARYSTAILSVVSNCPFTVYQDDLEPLIRLLVTALGKQPGGNGLSNDSVARRRTVSALEVLVEILANEPDALKGHLKAIITGGTSLYQEATGASSRQEEGGKHGGDRLVIMGRKLVLQLLGAMPTKFEERHLLAYAPQLKRILATACGDPVREIRKTAILARENWSKI